MQHLLINNTNKYTVSPVSSKADSLALSLALKNILSINRNTEF